MKNIAIFASGNGECAERVVSLFNEGNRICVKLVATDRENAEIIGRLVPYGIEVEFVPRDDWHSPDPKLVEWLNENNIELIALDDFRGVLPQEIEASYKGHIINLTTPEEAPREIVKALEDADTIKVEVKTEDKPRTVDEEWAEVLKIDFDSEKLHETPPPVPGSAANAPKETPQPQPVQPVFQNSPVQQLRPNPATPQEPMPSTYLIWSVLSTVFCCFVPGIVAIIFSSQVSTRYFTGDIEGAKRASSRAQIWIIVSFVLGVLSATLYLPIMLIS